MSLELYFHPLASYCWKVLIALYENQTPFAPRLVDLGDPASAAAFERLWPIRKFPVLHDLDRGQVVPESSIVIEYLDHHYPGSARLIPESADAAREVRLWDRFYDCYVHDPMQRIVADRLRPADAKDPYGVEQAQAQLRKSYSILETQLATRPWAAGAEFSLADCAAAPALHYANRVAPLGASHPHTRAYVQRLEARPSFARVLREAEPYFQFFPG
ncbi:MAG: glutathione S-transferase family protein [Polyangiaceae bacterium]